MDLLSGGRGTFPYEPVKVPGVAAAAVLSPESGVKRFSRTDTYSQTPVSGIETDRDVMCWPLCCHRCNYSVFVTSAVCVCV